MWQVLLQEAFFLRGCSIGRFYISQSLRCSFGTLQKFGCFRAQSTMQASPCRAALDMGWLRTWPLLIHRRKPRWAYRRRSAIRQHHYWPVQRHRKFRFTKATKGCLSIGITDIGRNGKAIPPEC